jgi:hypothetical protein
MTPDAYVDAYKAAFPYTYWCYQYGIYLLIALLVLANLGALLFWRNTLQHCKGQSHKSPAQELTFTHVVLSIFAGMAWLLAVQAPSYFVATENAPTFAHIMSQPHEVTMEGTTVAVYTTGTERLFGHTIRPLPTVIRFNLTNAKKLDIELNKSRLLTLNPENLSPKT